MQDKSAKQNENSSYFNKKFPAFLQQDFQTEANALWQELEQGLSEACQPSFPNFDHLITLIPRLEVFLTVYGPSQNQRETLATIFIRLLLEEKTTTINKIVVIRLILITLGSANLKNLRLNWKAFKEFFDEATADPRAAISQTPKGKLLREFLTLAKKIRILYPEESAGEVLRQIRQDFNPSVSSGFKGSQFLTLFFNVETPQSSEGKLNQEYFEKRVIPELFALWNGRRYQSEVSYIIVLARIAKKYPKIDWTPYYDQIFAYCFNVIKAEFPQKDGSNKDGSRQGRGRKEVRNPLSFVSHFLVRIMRPKTYQGGEQYWENLERIYRSTLPFIHPENAGNWSASLAQFYHDFSKFYIKRAIREQRQIEKKRLKNKDAMEEEKSEFDDKEKVKDDEDVERLDEVEIGFLDGDEEEGEQPKEEDEESEEDEEASEMTDLQGKTEPQQKDEQSEYLDEACHQKFLEMIEYALKNLIYSRDAKVTDQVAKTIRKLMFFRADLFGPFLIKTLTSFFQRSDLSHIGYIKILMLSAYPLLSRKHYKKGLYELPKFLDVTLEHLTSHDIKKTAMLLEFYEVVFALVPIYHPEDLKDSYTKLHGALDLKALKDKLNSNEDEDILKLSEDLSDWAVKFFRKFVDLLQNFEAKESPAIVKTTSLVINYRNLHSVIFQSSPRIIQKYLDIFKNYLEENLQNPPSQYLQDILHPLNLRDAEATLAQLIPVFKNQLLTKAVSAAPDNYSQKSLYNLIQKSPLYSHFHDYELKITNKDTLTRILTALQDVLTFSSPALLKYKDDVEMIILHCLLHEDHSVFIRASQLLHTTLLSLLSVYPTNLGYLNPQDLTQEEFGSIFKKIGRSSRKNLELEWHIPSEHEIKYAQDLFSIFFDRNLQDIEIQHLTNINQQKSSDPAILSSLLDDMHLKNANMSNTQRESLGRSLILVNYSFLGVCQRASYAGVANLSENKQKFENKFTLPAFKNAREKLYSIGNRLVKYTFSNLFVKDLYIGKALVQLIGTIYGEEEQHDELQRRKKILKAKKRAFELEGAHGDIYENRYLMAIHVNIKLQEKILGHSLGLEYRDSTLDLIYILWLFMFHPIDEIAKSGMKLFRRETAYMKPSKKNEVLLNVANYTVQFVNERFTFLRNNAKELEENKVLTYNQHQIIYNNKDSYVDTLLKGTLYNLEYLLSFLTNHLDNLFQFVQILLDVPKANDASFLLRFSKIVSGIDFSPYLTSDDLQNNPTKENPILSSNDLYLAYQQKLSLVSTKQRFYDKELLKPHIETQMKKVIFVLTHEESHWKFQIVAAFTGALLSSFLPAHSELLSEFIACVFQLLSSGHLYLRYFASSAFPALIKIQTNQFRKDSKIKRKQEDFKGLQLTLDDAFTYHFLKKEDYQNNFIKDPYVGILDFYEELEIDDLKEKPNVGLPKNLVEQIQGKEFLHKLLHNLVSDVPSQEETGTQRGGGGVAGLLGKMAFNFKGFIGEYFRLENHRSTRKSNKGIQTITSLFSQIEASLLRVLLKYFDGPKIFENSIDLIQEFAKDYNSREKQIIVAHYFYAAMKTYKFWDQASTEKATTKLVEILTNVVDNVSADTYKIWDVAFAMAIKGLDYRIAKVLFDKLLKNPFDKKLSSVQGRYLSLYEKIVDRNGVFSEEIVERFLDILTNFKPTETRQVEHIAQIFIIILKNYVLNPVNYTKLKQEGIVQDIDKIIQSKSGDFILENEYFLFKFNSKFDQILQNYAAWARESNNPEENKIYFELLFILTSSFYSKKLPYSLYLYYEKSIAFLLQLNSEENLSLGLNTIQAHKDSISTLSKLLYPREALPRILGIIEECLKAKNPKVRENALRFYHYFYYNHIFYLKNKTIDPVLNSILDENPVVKNTAFDAIADIFRLYTEKEIKDTVEKSKKLVEENKSKKNSENVTKGLFVLMALILSRPYEIEEWTDSTIEFLLETRKHSKSANEKFNKDFAVKFWDSHSGRANVNERELSYEVYSDLREIGNPSSYFA